jgi:phenylalanyl-tRNA synthetase alpha chain
MQEEIINLRNQVVAQINEAQDISELENIRISYLGRNGKLTSLIKKIRQLPAEEKKSAGILINETKNTIIKLLASKSNRIKNSARIWFDPTVPGIKPEKGHLHLVTQAIEEISQVFERIGFVRARYPEVEWDWFAFGSLNFPENHPARDEWETFFVDVKANPKYGPMLLTPHTSSGQVREMLRVNPPAGGPIRMINISKCYRRQSDASHVPMFHQFEGLVIDKAISIVHLKGTLDYFAKTFLGTERKTRIRPYHFQFTEPSFEVDVSCDICHGKGCKLCKEGWLELGGAGMVHPKVLKNGGVDPKKYSGFAFGWGVERALMMKGGLGIDDLRTMYGLDLRYLTQF